MFINTTLRKEVISFRCYLMIACNGNGNKMVIKITTINFNLKCCTPFKTLIFKCFHFLWHIKPSPLILHLCSVSLLISLTHCDIRKVSNISCTKSQNLNGPCLVLQLSLHNCSCLCTIYWNRVFSQEWRCSWSSADRRCSNNIWVIDNFVAY